jgi:hypothetical protein
MTNDETKAAASPDTSRPTTRETKATARPADPARQYDLAELHRLAIEHRRRGALLTATPALRDWLRDVRPLLEELYAREHRRS